jgi:antitoxin component YwqK of YwqJK toxin-antitoxin module
MRKLNFKILTFIITCLTFIDTVNGQEIKEVVLQWAKTNYNFQCDNPENISVEFTNDTYYLNYDCSDKENYRMTYSNSIRVGENATGKIWVENGYCYRYKLYNRKIEEDEKYLIFNNQGYIYEVGYYQLDSGGSREGSWGDFIDRNYDKSNVVAIKKYPGNDYNEYQMSMCKGGEEPIKVTEYYDNKSLKSIYDKSKKKYEFYLRDISTPDFILELRNGKFHGSFVSHYKNGQIKVKARYVEGKYDGNYEEFTEFGDTLYFGYYRNGKKNGEWKELVAPEKVKFLSSMNIGILFSTIGDSTFLNNPDIPKVYMKGVYNDSERLEGKIEITSKKNSLIAVYNVKNGETIGDQILYHPNGKVFGKIKENDYPRFYDARGNDITLQIINKYNEEIKKL